MLTLVICGYIDWITSSHHFDCCTLQADGAASRLHSITTKGFEFASGLDSQRSTQEAKARRPSGVMMTLSTEAATVQGGPNTPRAVSPLAAAISPVSSCTQCTVPPYNTAVQKARPGENGGPDAMFQTPSVHSFAGLSHCSTDTSLGALGVPLRDGQCSSSDPDVCASCVYLTVVQASWSKLPTVHDIDVPCFTHGLAKLLCAVVEFRLCCLPECLWRGKLIPIW